MSSAVALPLRAEIARKALHVATAAFPIGLAFGWSDLATLRALLSAAAVAALAVEALRRMPAAAAWFARVFGSMLRDREAQAITGATWLAIAMAAVLWSVPEGAAVAALWAAAVGDAAAAIVGRLSARREPRAAHRKTAAGSLAALVATALGVWWLTPASVAVSVALGAVAAAAERPALPVDDNLRVALAVAVAATLLGLR